METFDLIVIGSGPAGQKAAIQGAKAERRVLVIERERGVGGACVHRGTIPSKTLRETSIVFSNFRRRTDRSEVAAIQGDSQIASLMSRKDRVIGAHEAFIHNQLARNGIESWHGRAAFAGSHEVDVTSVRGEVRRASASTIVIATGSQPRTPDDIPVDHEHILDSDSILSLLYLPKSMAVLGSGVVASEYATIFAALGTEVTMIDKYPSPLGFLDRELTERFVTHFETEMGSRFLGEVGVEAVRWNGADAVETQLSNGEVVRTEKLLCAQGRVACVQGLNLQAAGLEINARGLIDVNEQMQTAASHIYAAGDVIGPPALASTSMEQGRRAVLHAIGMPTTTDFSDIPMGIFTIPEMASIGLTHAQAEERHGTALVGRANFSELARGQISCCTDGLLKLVADPENSRILGVQIFGEGATELIHVGQMGMLGGMSTDVYVESIFNFPTLAEAYRVAALDIRRQRSARSAGTNS